MRSIQVKLRAAVQSLINKSRGTHCEQCLSKKQLQVKVVYELEELARRFAEEYPADEFDKASYGKPLCMTLHAARSSVNIGLLSHSCIPIKCESFLHSRPKTAVGVERSRVRMDDLPGVGDLSPNILVWMFPSSKRREVRWDD